ncbi:MAG: hypothetical protein JOZ94_03345 [Xanthobacteraceae bacterium]|nr:hypothetical protein [Xanthobacteraceae bacterium]
MADDNRIQVPNQIVVQETADQLRGDQKHLQTLWESHWKTQAVIQRSLEAIKHSEALLDQIDGKPHWPLSIPPDPYPD